MTHYLSPAMKDQYPTGNPLTGRVTVTHVPKPWGYEVIWAHTDHYVGKILHVNAGQALSQRLSGNVFGGNEVAPLYLSDLEDHHNVRVVNA